MKKSEGSSFRRRDASVKDLESIVEDSETNVDKTRKFSSKRAEEEWWKKRIAKRRVSDVFDDEQIKALQTSLAVSSDDEDSETTEDLEPHAVAKKWFFLLPLVMLLIVMTVPMNGSNNQEVGKNLSVLDDESTVAPNSRDLSNIFLKNKKLECTVTLLEALVPPGVEELPKQYFCEAKNGEVYSFDSDPSSVLKSGFISGQTTMKLPLRYLDTETNHILISEAIESNAVSASNPIAGRGTSTIAGEFDVLVIRVVDEHNHVPKQCEVKLHNDIFADLKSVSDMLFECSNSKLQIMPAEGENVVNGVLTVNATENLANVNFRKCGKYGIDAAKHVHRHYTMIVCPDEVSFNGAAAYAEKPGRISYFKSTYASYKFIHLHEMAHNLGGFHSGTLDGGPYDDYTCALGNKGAWNERGSAFCFNGVKTWQFGWYSDYHRELDPSEHPHQGDLYGINAVNDKSAQLGSGDVDIRVSSTDIDEVLYVTYLRKAGPNRDVPKYGDSVLVHRTASKSFDTGSELVASMKAGEKLERVWDDSGKLIIEVCSIDAGSSGKASILIYAEGNDGGMKCDSDAPLDPVEDSPEPDNTCQDSTRKISFNHRSGKNMKKPCSWVAKDTNNRCKIPEMKEGCPVTCGADCQCIQTSSSFKVKSKERSCNFVGQKKVVRCKRRLFYAHCPKLCTPMFETKAKHCTE